MVLYSKKIYDTYSPQEQQALMECAIVGRDEQRKASRALNGKSLDNLKAKGMAVNEISPAEHARMRERVLPVYEKNATVIGEDTVKLMQTELAKLRK
jgi:TRAP-type C4-dicarboxylate transport system substrate-binding protein